MHEQADAMPQPVLISVIMPVCDPADEYLDQSIWSVRNQIYQQWELCIADDASQNTAIRDILNRHASEDARVKLIFREVNGHISAASNSALELASGDFIALMDHDDLIPPHALLHVAMAIQAHPHVSLVYTDEDKIDKTGKRTDPYFKCAFNPDLMRSHNMICHLGVYRTQKVLELGRFRQGMEGAQDYDLALRMIEAISPQQIVHISKVLYHWRISRKSTALSGAAKPYALEAGRKAIVEHLHRTGFQTARVHILDTGMYRVRYPLPASPPLVSVIIPTRNRHDLLGICLDSIQAKTTYPRYEILIVDNGSDDSGTLAFLADLAQKSTFRILRDNRPFNFAGLINAAVKQARGSVLALVNNDVEVITPEWLDEMVSLAVQPGVGAVGARLWYPDDTLQHGGVIVGIGGVAGHAHEGLPRYHHGYVCRAVLIQSMSAVTAACLVIRKKIFEEVGGMDEDNLGVAFNDVDFCLRIREAGYRNVWTPYAELYHHEYSTRGYDNTREKQARFQQEVQHMKNRWEDMIANDPAYSPNLSLDHCDFSYAWPPRNISFQVI